jgi:hypothetical protein
LHHWESQNQAFDLGMVTVSTLFGSLNSTRADWCGSKRSRLRISACYFVALQILTSTIVDNKQQISAEENQTTQQTTNLEAAVTLPLRRATRRSAPVEIAFCLILPRPYFFLSGETNGRRDEAADSGVAYSFSCLAARVVLKHAGRIGEKHNFSIIKCLHGMNGRNDIWSLSTVRTRPTR